MHQAVQQLSEENFFTEQIFIKFNIEFYEIFLTLSNFD
jgi:hypothetical protein